MSVFLLDRLMCCLFVAALALTVLDLTKGRGRRLSWTALAMGIGILVKGWWDGAGWNGHDWIADGDDLIRDVGAIAGMIAFALLWRFPSAKRKDARRNWRNAVYNPKEFRSRK